MVERSKVRAPEKRIQSEQVDDEVERFLRAIQESRKQLMEIKEKILDPEVRRHSFILDVHLMILDDQMLIQDTIETIRKKKVNAEWALDLTWRNWTPPSRQSKTNISERGGVISTMFRPGSSETSWERSTTISQRSRERLLWWLTTFLRQTPCR